LQCYVIKYPLFITV